MSDNDWSLLTEETDEIAGRAAARVVAQYPRLEQEDLHQEARIILCSNPRQVKEYLDNDDLGYLARWLWQRLVDKVKTDGKRLEKNVSYERELEKYATVDA